MTGSHKFTLGTFTLNLLVCAYLLVTFNGAFFNKVVALTPIDSIRSMLFMVSVVVFLLAIFTTVLQWLAIPHAYKPLLMLLVLTAAATDYFSQAYGVVIDKTMIQNVMETDARESKELMTASAIIHLILFGVIPSVFIGFAPLRYRSVAKESLLKLAVPAGALGAIVVIAAFFYQDYASMFRNHRYIRDFLIPVNYIYSTSSYLHHQLPSQQKTLAVIGEDATRTEASSLSPRRLVTVLVVGETARAVNFSTNGYARETTPMLKKEDILNFSATHSCGTSTAVSVPCMFSSKDRKHFDGSAARYQENLLDILQRAGVAVLWKDNNSGCKGVCDRVPSESVNPTEYHEYCDGDECYDEALLQRLVGRIDSTKGDMLIVLHQKGSHGPAYALRTPQKFRKFQPVCQTAQLQECSQQEITNAYDNTILYTDYFLGQLIALLKAHGDDIDAGLIYLSDHGESLGESNIYLHGLPYFMAPDEQTHVPFIAWFSNNFYLDQNMDKTCLQAKQTDALSHDNLFHSLLGLYSVTTRVYQPENDLFLSCRTPQWQLAAKHSLEARTTLTN